MRVVKYLLLTEGSSEEPLAEHLEVLCFEEGADQVRGSWIDFSKVLDPPGKRTSEQLRWVIERGSDANLVFIHRDADARDDGGVRRQIERDAHAAGLRSPYVPVVPIQEIEAWLLLDEDEIRRVAGNPKGRAELGLPKPNAIERLANPKELLQRAISRAAKPGRRKPNFPACRRRLLERLDLEGPINQLSAWQKLRSDIQAALAAMYGEGDDSVEDT